MLKIGDNIYRNLEEQVQKNKEDIARHWETDRVLADFGIKVLGVVPDVEALEALPKEDLVYGDGYLVGSQPPFIVYIWTRPNINVGKTEPYWLEIGSISIVGPRGPEGPKGDKGDKGESSRWYAFSFPPTYVTGDWKEGDMGIVVGSNSSNDGNIYRFSFENSPFGAWTLHGNIRGPQGIQGPMGLQGPQGVQGPAGEKGERGDVGGFINIWGILDNTEQLPTPESLNNLTVAYLVAHTGGTDQANDHYDLYIQVGESSETAVWENVGPFNAATLVTSGGAGLNVFDADSKLDIPTSSDTIYREPYVKAYETKFTYAQRQNNYVGWGSEAGGWQPASYILNTANVTWQNGEGNNAVLCQMCMPSKAYHLVNKRYADETLLHKSTDAVGGTNKVVGIDTNGITKYWNANPIYIYNTDEYGSVFPIYKKVGKSVVNADQNVPNTIYVADPQLDYEAANKRYVDTKTNYRLLGTADLSSGETSYSIDTTGCRELMLVSTTNVDCAGAQYNWKRSNTMVYEPKGGGSITTITQLDDAICSVVGPRNYNDTLLKSSILNISDTTVETLTISFSTATSGIIKIYGR